MFAIGLRPGDELIVPAYGYHAAVHPILYTGAIPVFCDVEPTSFSLDTEQVVARITDRTRGIVDINMWGIPGDLRRLREIADAHDLYLIEDASRGLGGTVGDNAIGSIGHIGCFSFSTGKVISASEGGILVTDDDVLYSRALSIGHPVFREPADRQYVAFSDTALGVKHNIHPLSVCIASAKLKELQKRSLQCGENYASFLRALDGLPFLRTMKTKPADRRGAWSGIAFSYDSRALGLSTQLFAEALRAEGCRVKMEYESNILYRGNALRNAHLFFETPTIGPPGPFPVTETIGKELLVAEGVVSYSIPIDELADAYGHAVEKVASAAAAIGRQYSE